VARDFGQPVGKPQTGGNCQDGVDLTIPVEEGLIYSYAGANGPAITPESNFTPFGPHPIHISACPMLHSPGCDCRTIPRRRTNRSILLLRGWLDRRRPDSCRQSAVYNWLAKGRAPLAQLTSRPEREL